MQEVDPIIEKGILNNCGTYPLKVLLVDDKQENLFSLEKLLEDDEYQVQFIKCTSGNDALNIALKEELALILLDVQMPGMDGYEVAKLLKANKKTSAIPLIFVTALDHELNYILEGYKKGAVDYLFKPLNPSITRAKVRAFIQGYLQQKELEQKNIMLHHQAMLINNSIDLMCILDTENLAIQSINPAWQKILGLKTEDILHLPISKIPGKNALGISIPENTSCFTELLETDKNVVVFENVLTTEKKDILWFSWSFVRKGNLWYGNGKDITKNKLIEKELESANEKLEQKVLQRTADLLNANQQLKEEIVKRKYAEKELKHFNEKLIKANEELESFVYIASHDLKAPIANIEALFNSLQSKIHDKVSESERKIFSMVGRSIDKFNSILFDLGRIISIQKDLEDEYSEVNLRSTLEDVVDDIQDIITESSAEIKAEFEVENLFYARKHVRSILYNLLSNAIKYRSPERLPLIEVKCKDNKDFFTLSVKDNGLGLNEIQQKKMFTMFKRFHNHVAGSGIGLYLLKKIIDNSGGSIELESTEGVGSEFKAYLKKIDKDHI
jgi:signal transduction histidine kinase/FixJ family two-component response regulator